VEGARIVARLAMSLDGYIADADGGYDWIRPEYVRRRP
jgi:riboflavin biosynthesis pyrimidine reductase